MYVPPLTAVFPPLQARNLNGRTLALPAAFAGVRNVVIVAFRRAHQDLVDSWFLALAPLLAADPNLRAYEVPMLARGYTLVRPFIDGGMAVAMPNLDVRERTLTVYTNVAKVIAALQIRSPETITSLLVERSGQIAWPLLWLTGGHGQVISLVGHHPSLVGAAIGQEHVAGLAIRNALRAILPQSVMSAVQSAPGAQPMKPSLDTFWSLPAVEVLERLDGRPQGLSKDQAAQARTRYGPNTLRPPL
jgi:hypothetical protein